MKKKLRKTWETFVFSRRDSLFKLLYNITYGYRNGIRILSDSNGMFIPTRYMDNNICIYLARPRSAYRFRKGIEKRLRCLSEEYFLDFIPIMDGDVVVDVGANLGEIGLIYQALGISIRYIYVEPEKLEIEACRLNNPNQIEVFGALWKTDEKIKFFHAPETQDSSTIESSMHHSKSFCNAFTLESVLKMQSIKSVKLLKLEAEGAEPEVLQGAESVLSKIEYISADLGPERGISNECTIEAVTNFLLERKFDLIKVYHPRRLSCLYKNKCFEPQND